jgi:hypothetical protein
MRIEASDSRLTELDDNRKTFLHVFGDYKTCGKAN